MPKYLFTANYTQTGFVGLIAEGGTSRADAIREGVESTGGSVESMYYALGDADLYVISELPDDEAAATLSFIVGAAGGATTRVTKLLTPEQIDDAAERSATYRPPGG
jgi:uncharacterized protein with GYD domain